VNEGNTREAVSSVSPKGQITIPAAIRHLLGVGPKDRVAFRVENGEVVIRPARFHVWTRRTAPYLRWPDRCPTRR